MDDLRKRARQEWDKFEQQLKDWGVDLETFRTRASRASADVKVDYDKQIAALRIRLGEARQKLDELRKTGGAAGGEMEKGLEAAWSELKKAFEAARGQIKQAEQGSEGKGGPSAD